MKPVSKSDAVLASIKSRTGRSIARGEDGFIDPTMLSFDVGICRRKVRIILTTAASQGLVEQKSQGPGRPCFFRFIGVDLTT